MDSDADPGCPRTYGSGCGSGTLLKCHVEVTIHKTEEIKAFLTIFAWWWKDPEPYPYLWQTDPDADPGGTKTYGSKHRFFANLLIRFYCIQPKLNCLVEPEPKLRIAATAPTTATATAPAPLHLSKTGRNFIEKIMVAEEFFVNYTISILFG